MFKKLLLLIPSTFLSMMILGMDEPLMEPVTCQYGYRKLEALDGVPQGSLSIHS